MTPERVEIAINDVCMELAPDFHYSPSWMDRSETELFREMVASILGSRVTFDMALAATDTLEEEGLLEQPADEAIYLQKLIDVLSRPLFSPNWPNGRRYRFPVSRAKAISQTSKSFYSSGSNIRDWLGSCGEPSHARREMIKTAPGIGPKQASMYLRNVGFSSKLAILDSHILRFMNLIGLNKQKGATVSTIRGYEKAEQSFLRYADKVGWPAGILDQAVWIVMRVYLREQL